MADRPELSDRPTEAVTVPVETLDDAYCPCCTGATDGEWEALCDTCLAAWLTGAPSHDCDRPQEASRGD